LFDYGHNRAALNAICNVAERWPAADRICAPGGTARRADLAILFDEVEALRQAIGRLQHAGRAVIFCDNCNGVRAGLRSRGPYFDGQGAGKRSRVEARFATPAAVDTLENRVICSGVFWRAYRMAS
jgi:hypothetical protein